MSDHTTQHQLAAVKTGEASISAALHIAKSFAHGASALAVRGPSGIAPLNIRRSRRRLYAAQVRLASLARQCHNERAARHMLAAKAWSNVATKWREVSGGADE